MRTEPLSLAHQDLLDSRFKQLQIELSEYTFANLYLFRHVHQYEVLYSQQDLYIQGKTRDGFLYLMPTTPLEKLNTQDITDCLSSRNFLFPIAERWGPFFDSSHFEATFNEDESDYLFSIEKMRTYSGRHLSGRRNLVKQYKERYPNQTVHPLDSHRIDDAKQVLEQWHAHASENDQATDYTECTEAIQLAALLKLNGRIYYIDDKPVGLLIGEPLNQEVYVFHFAKAMIEYKGIYQYIYQEFALSLENQYKWINLEQDLGSEEQRHAKHAYLPDHLASKLRISLKK